MNATRQKPPYSSLIQPGPASSSLSEGEGEGWRIPGAVRT